MLTRHSLSSLTIVCALAGCSTSPSTFIEEQYNLSDLDVCRNYLNDKEDISKYRLAQEKFEPSEVKYLKSLARQVKSRDLSSMECEALVSEQNKKNWATALMIMGAAAAAGAAAYDQQDYNSYDYNTYSPSYSNDSGTTGYAWDAFYDQYRNLIWRCRDKSNGQFASSYSCYGLPKNDYTWPDK